MPPKKHIAHDAVHTKGVKASATANAAMFAMGRKRKRVDLIALGEQKAGWNWGFVHCIFNRNIKQISTMSMLF